MSWYSCLAVNTSAQNPKSRVKTPKARVKPELTVRRFSGYKYLETCGDDCAISDDTGCGCCDCLDTRSDIWDRNPLGDPTFSRQAGGVPCRRFGEDELELGLCSVRWLGRPEPLV